MLVAVDAGSNQVSALSASSAGLGLLNTVSSGGSFPNSVAVRGGLVYVLNAHATPNITAFQLGSGGLTPIAGSTRNLPGGSAAAPHDVRFSPDGTRVIVAEGGTNQLDVFDIAGSGVVTQPSAGRGPFALAFARSGVLANAEASSGSVSSYELTAQGTLAVVSPAVPDGQSAACWITVTGDGKFAFVSNTGSGNLSTYQVSGNGTVNLEQPVAATADGGAPIDSALTSDGSFLYVVDSALGRVLIYRANGASLALVGNVGGLPTTVQGIAAD
jgi:6-phosphogluconolactonase (cycloisomerase 2 family)